jgi:hypothetical protein
MFFFYFFYVKPRIHEQFFLDKFYMLVCTEKDDNFSVPRSLVAKLDMPAFGQGNFVRVYEKYSKYFYGFGKQRR